MTGFRKNCLNLAAAVALLMIGSMLTKYRLTIEERLPQKTPEGSLQTALQGSMQESPEKSLQTAAANSAIVDEKQLFSFIPAGLKNCETLFRNGRDATMNFSSDYLAARKEFDTILNIILRLRGEPPEGHIGTQKEQSLAYFLLARAGFVKTICETGFNAGHSALIFLSANPNVHVYSFDLGNHEYSKTMARYMKAKFPGRLTVTWGDSVKTVPAFVKANPDVKCDIVSVDGGHKYIPCKADLKNMRGLARKSYHLVYIDDYPTIPSVKKAWEEEVTDDQVKEHFKCKFYSNRMRGFAVGRYTNL